MEAFSFRKHQAEVVCACVILQGEVSQPPYTPKPAVSLSPTSKMKEKTRGFYKRLASRTQCFS